jgi:hypothetical protein
MDEETNAIRQIDQLVLPRPEVLRLALRIATALRPWPDPPEGTTPGVAMAYRAHIAKFCLNLAEGIYRKYLEPADPPASTPAPDKPTTN